LGPAILDCLDYAWYIDGPAVKAFETEFAGYCETKHCVALDSGTAAIHLTLLALGIGPGDEVIVPCNTFIASAAPVVAVGATVVLVDSDPETWLMDVDQVKAKITPKTKAVIAVHLYGQTVPMTLLREVCERAGIALVEDAAQSQGARYQGKRAGGLGDIACFSFYPGKNLGAYGDAGAITTDDAEIAERIRRLANHGRGASKYEHVEIGYNFRMDEIQGVVLKYKLDRLDQWNARRRELAKDYRSNLAGLPVEFYEVRPECEAIYHLMAVCCDDPKGLSKLLAENSIETGFHYPIPIHLQSAFREMGGGTGDYPVSEQVAARTISLPIFPEMTDEQLTWVCDTVREFYSSR
jgi:dTDP-4-amino-4,6-dideoxygalactose transaminase